jgi:hypothetical protein
LWYKKIRIVWLLILYFIFLEMILTTPSFDVNSVAATREALGKRLGEIITELIGDDRIQKLFEAAGKHPDEYKDQPTGDIALKLGVISPKTKNALLILQAGERAYAMSDLAEYIVVNLDQLEKEQKTPSVGNYIKDLFHPDYRYVGSEKDEVSVKFAQSVMMLSQATLNEEDHSLYLDILGDQRGAHYDPFREAFSRGVERPQGLKKAAAELFITGGRMLVEEGHIEAAQRAKAVFYALMVKKEGLPTPESIAVDFLSNFNRGTLNIAIGCNDSRYIDYPEKYSGEVLFEKLIKLSGIPAEALRPEYERNNGPDSALNT